jgi:phage FluMu protein Com
MASITFRCSSCEQMLRAGAEKAGKKVKCGKCGTIMTVPSDEVESAELIEPTSAAPPARGRAPAPRDDVDFEAGPPPRRRRHEEDSDYEAPPRRSRRASADEEDDDYDRPRQRRRDRDDDLDRIRKGPGPARPTGMVTLIGVLNLLFAGVFIVSCIAFMVAGSTLLNMMTGMTEKALDQAPFPRDDPQGKKVVEHGKEMMRGMAAMGTFVFVLGGSCAAILLGGPLILAGIGVLKRRQWGRVLALILGVLAMLAAAGLIYELWPLNRYAWISVGVNFTYGLITFVILLIPEFAEEFE